jgi:hypothetical protein
MMWRWQVAIAVVLVALTCVACQNTSGQSGVRPAAAPKIGQMPSSVLPAAQDMDDAEEDQPAADAADEAPAVEEPDGAGDAEAVEPAPADDAEEIEKPAPPADDMPEAEAEDKGDDPAPADDTW